MYTIYIYIYIVCMYIYIYIVYVYIYTAVGLHGRPDAHGVPWRVCTSCAANGGTLSPNRNSSIRRRCCKRRMESLICRGCVVLLCRNCP